MSDRDPMFDPSLDGVTQEPEPTAPDDDLHPPEPSMDADPAGGEPADEPEPDEGGAEPEPLLAGKFKSVEDLERGYSDSARAQLLAEERARLYQEELARRQQSSGPPPDPFEQEREALKEAGHDESTIDLIIGIAQRAARAEVPSELQQNLSPLLNSAAARQGMTLADQQRLDAALQSDPEFAELFNSTVLSNPTGARALAKMRMQMEDGLQQARASSDAIKSKRQDAKRDASGIPRRTSPGRESPTKSQANAQREERLTKLTEFAQRTGDSNPLARELLSGLEIWDESGRRKLK